MENILNGFEVFNDLTPGAIANNKPATDPELIEELLGGAAEELTDEELEALRNPVKPVEEELEEEELEEDPVKPAKATKKTAKEVEPEIELEEEQEEDSTAISAFFEVLSDKMGLELGEEDKAPSTPEELVEYFLNIIEENSTPQYYSEEVEALDAFVKNGGNLRDYLQIDRDLDLDEIDLTDEDNQKLVVKLFLKEKGINSKSIEKKLSKYEDAGLLEDEAEDALEALKEIKTQKKQQLLQEQEKAAEASRKSQQEYFNSVVNEIKGMDNIRGVKIPEKDKKVLLEYIFKPDAEGMTKFQKDWSKNVKHLLESAYFTMKGDTLLKAAKVEGSNNAINKFKNSLSRTGVGTKTKKTETDNSEDTMWGSFARQLRAN